MQYEDGVSQLSYYPKNVGFDSEQMVQTVLTRWQYFRHKFQRRTRNFSVWYDDWLRWRGGPANIL